MTVNNSISKISQFSRWVNDAAGRQWDSKHLNDYLYKLDQGAGEGEPRPSYINRQGTEIVRFAKYMLGPERKMDFLRAMDSRAIDRPVMPFPSQLKIHKELQKALSAPPLGKELLLKSRAEDAFTLAQIAFLCHFGARPNEAAKLVQNQGTWTELGADEIRALRQKGSLPAECYPRLKTAWSFHLPPPLTKTHQPYTWILPKVKPYSDLAALVMELRASDASQAPSEGVFSRRMTKLLAEWGVPDPERWTPKVFRQNAAMAAWERAQDKAALDAARAQLQHTPNSKAAIKYILQRAPRFVLPQPPRPPDLLEGAIQGSRQRRTRRSSSSSSGGSDAAADRFLRDK